MTRPLNDNINFFLNMVEYASSDDSLIHIRSKANPKRFFVRVSDLYKEVEGRIRSEEITISKEVSILEQKLIQLTSNADVNYKDIPQELRNELNQVGEKLMSSRKNLRKIRYKIYQYR